MGYLNNLQKKDSAEKVRFMWIAIIVCGVIIFLGWLIFFPKDYLKKEGQKSFGDIQREFNESEANIKFDEYMNSLDILNGFEDNFNLDEALNGLDMPKNNYNETGLDETGLFGDDKEENTTTNRLPLEKDIEVEITPDQNTN